MYIYIYIYIYIAFSLSRRCSLIISFCLVSLSRSARAFANSVFMRATYSCDADC